MATLNFNIQGRHESHRGEAEILDSRSEVKTRATELFVDNGDNRRVTVNSLGGFEGYEIFESYTDSGSNDYFYFAVKTI